MSVYKNLLDGMVWSYSRLTAYEHCPFSWYRRYIEWEVGQGSFYADNGKAMHEVFDELVKGTVSFEDAPSLYLEKYEQIENSVKQEIMDKTFDACVNYLCNINENILDGYHVVGSEVKLEFKIGEYDFVGYIDLLLQDDEDNLIVVDHKSSDPFLKKNGEPYAKTKEQFENYIRQQCLYCIGIKEKLGEYPKKIVFHHFKNDGRLTIVPVKEELIDGSKAWALNVISQIYSDEKFEAMTKTGFCYRLCDYRYDCEYTKEEDDEV